MDFLTEVIEWFTTAENWQGTTGVPHRLWEHVLMSLAAVAAASLLSLPAGVWLGHVGKGGTLAINIANVGRAIPSYGILVIMAQAIGLSGWPGFGARPAFVALVALAIPPMLTNAYVGVREVDEDLRSAGLGMGLTDMQVLRQVELPLAMPLIVGGLRTSAVQVVATATLAALTAWGGLGRFIVDGFAQQDEAQLFAGALLVAVLSIITEVALAAVQRLVTPKGLKEEAAPALIGPPSTVPEATAPAA